MVNHNAHLLALPESERIEQLLDDLLPSPPAPWVAAGAATTSASVPGGWAVGQFLAGINWQNDAEFVSPRRPASAQEAEPPRNGSKSAAVMGALTVHTFLSAVNWSNRADARRLTFQDEDVVSRARMVVEAFMDEVAWD